MDKSYFGGRCRSRRGRGASGKVVVFGILKRNGRVYIVAVDNAKSDALPVIKQKIMPDSIENFGIRQNASCENTTESIANLSRCS